MKICFIGTLISDFSIWYINIWC